MPKVRNYNHLKDKSETTTNKKSYMESMTPTS